MTAMSELARTQAVGPRPNRLKLQAFATVARVVHAVPTVVRGSVLLLALPLLWIGAGCVIPPSLSVDNQDAGINSPPAITAVRYDTEQLVEPGPFVVIRGLASGDFQVEAVDTDDDDSLYVRVFVGYRVDDPSPSRAGCTAGAGMPGVATRSCTARITAICQLADVNVERLMNVRVFDRMPDDDGKGLPQFQSMSDSRGATTSETFTLKCQE